MARGKIQVIETGGSDGQVLVRRPSTDNGLAWEASSGGGGGSAWGDITGTLSGQADLQAALDAKADSSSLPFAKQFAKVAAQRTSTSTTLVAISDLVLPVVANGIYQVKAKVVFRTAATTTGLRLGYSGPTGMTASINLHVPVSAAAVATELKSPATGNTGNIVGTGVSSISLDHVAEVEGFIYVGGTAGNFSITFGTEVAASQVTIQTTSALLLERIQ